MFLCITTLTVLYSFTLVNWLPSTQPSLALFSIPLFSSALLLSRIQKPVSQISMMVSLEQPIEFCCVFFFFQWAPLLFAIHVSKLCGVFIYLFITECIWCSAILLLLRFFCSLVFPLRMPWTVMVLVA